jgi:hypothetical protein
MRGFKDAVNGVERETLEAPPEPKAEAKDSSLWKSG